MLDVTRRSTYLARKNKAYDSLDNSILTWNIIQTTYAGWAASIGIVVPQKAPSIPSPLRRMTTGAPYTLVLSATSHGIGVIIRR